jgi:hypothetical protein
MSLPPSDAFRLAEEARNNTHRAMMGRSLAHCQNHSARIGLGHAVMAGICQNGSVQDQWVVAGSNPAA